MLTLNITNTSGSNIVAGDGTLPRMLSWLDLDDTDNVDVVIQVHDMDRIENGHSGFTMGELLQQLKQAGKLTFNVTDVGDTEDVGSLADEAVATAA